MLETLFSFISQDIILLDGVINKRNWRFTFAFFTHGGAESWVERIIQGLDRNFASFRSVLIRICSSGRVAAAAIRWAKAIWCAAERAQMLKYVEHQVVPSR
jgi:hypothetical protein